MNCNIKLFFLESPLREGVEIQNNAQFNALSCLHLRVEDLSHLNLMDTDLLDTDPPENS